MTLSEKNKQALLVGTILGIAILVIIVYLGLMFVRGSVNSMIQEEKKLTTQLQKDKKDLIRFQEYLKNEDARDDIQEAFFRIKSRLPDRQDPIEIFDLLRDYFEGTDVAFTYLEPGPLKRRERFTEHPFSFRGSARYHEFGQLINLIECNPNRLMRVSNFKLTNNNRRPSIHPMEVGITTFTFNEN